MIEVTLKRNPIDGRVFESKATASDGKVFYGRGLNEKQAEDDVIERVTGYEAYLCLPTEDKLRTLLAKPKILDDDKERCIRLLAELLLGSESVSDKPTKRRTIWFSVDTRLDTEQLRELVSSRLDGLADCNVMNGIKVS